MNFEIRVCLGQRVFTVYMSTYNKGWEHFAAGRIQVADGNAVSDAERDEVIEAAVELVENYLDGKQLVGSSMSLN